LQGYFTNGYFVEAPSASDASYLKKIEKKKLLSGVESLGLLSKAEKAGLTLSTVRWVQSSPAMFACLLAIFSSSLSESHRVLTPDVVLLDFTLPSPGMST
jgi:hypothetical protein